MAIVKVSFSQLSSRTLQLMKDKLTLTLSLNINTWKELQKIDSYPIILQNLNHFTCARISLRGTGCISHVNKTTSCIDFNLSA